MPLTHAAARYQDHPNGNEACGTCPYFVFPKSCAVVALRVMRAGGADALVPSYAKRNPAIITPQAVWIYAKSAAKHSAE